MRLGFGVLGLLVLVAGGSVFCVFLVWFFFNPFWCRLTLALYRAGPPPAAEPMGKGGCSGAPGGAGRWRGRAPPY